MATTMHHVRPATESDAEEMCRVFRESVREMGSACYAPGQIESWAGGMTVERCLQRIRTGCVLIAEIDGKQAGWGQIDVGTGEVDMLYVAPEYVRRGVGTALMRYMEDLAARKGVETLRLRASLNAVPFYRHAGFTEVETIIHRTPDGTEFTCVNMEKRL